MTWPGWISPCSGRIWPRGVVAVADLCLTCGHQHRHHSGLANMIDCDIPGCSCTKFEPADPKIEQTQGGDAHDLSDSSPGNRRAGADVTGPAVASSPATAGPP